MTDMASVTLSWLGIATATLTLMLIRTTAHRYPKAAPLRVPRSGPRTDRFSARLT
jgi:hypothetical protein